MGGPRTQMANQPKLHPELVAKLEAYRVTRAFDPAEWANRKVDKLNAYMSAAGLKSCITSVSGGIDSAVTLALCARAKKADGSPIVHNVAVCQPISSSAWAEERGRENVTSCDATLVVINQTDLHQQLQSLVDTQVGIAGKAFASGQLRSYMRTPVGYYVAQLYSQEGNPAIVMGTGNQDEDGYLAYFCKAGDGVVDVQMISDLHKNEVYVVAKHLGVPDATVVAPPSADLWDGQTDEEELGFTYDFIELFTGSYLVMDQAQQAEFVASLGDEAKTQFESWSTEAVKVHRRNAHKIAGVQNL